MNYEEFAKEYRRLFALMVKHKDKNPHGACYVDCAAKMADLSEKVPAEWVDRVEGVPDTYTLCNPKKEG